MLAKLVLCIGVLVALAIETSGLEVLYALNAGGDAFTDSLGIRYRRDFLSEGIASDYGKMLDIKRVTLQDKILYQTERYHTETFGYTIPMPPGDGDYVLWLKFSEVWFNAPNLKVFDVALNDVVVIKDLDIFGQVGRGVGHDEVIGFKVRSNKIVIDGKSQPFTNDIRVDFVKTDRDNPKINAIIIAKGTPDQIPKLPPYEPEKVSNPFDEESIDEFDEDKSEGKPIPESPSDDEEEEELRRNRNNKKKRQPEPEIDIINPYEADQTSYFLPIAISVAAFIPLLYCICRL